MTLNSYETAQRPPLREAIYVARCLPEAEVLQRLLAEAHEHGDFNEDQRLKAQALATHWIQWIRAQKRPLMDVDALLATYDLSTAQGLALMHLAEALLRIPDAATQNALVQQCLGPKDANEVLDKDSSTPPIGLLPRIAQSAMGMASSFLGGRASRRLPQPLQSALTGSVRFGVRHAVQMLGNYFVMAPTLPEGLKKAQAHEARGMTFSYDMLGEAALTYADAQRYADSYAEALEATGRQGARKDLWDKPGVSIKLSALHPRYEFSHYPDLLTSLVPKLKGLLMIAKTHNMPCTLDAEEVDRLDIMLDIVEILLHDPDLNGWDGLGLAIQAYQTRALPTLQYLADLCARTQRRINIRLVKGAYWDTEVKRAQILGVEHYPVLMRKPHTDVSYLCCATFMLQHRQHFRCSFATHNPLTIASLVTMLQKSPQGGEHVEFQRLHGMGEDIYAAFYAQRAHLGLMSVGCRIYAPIGPYKELLPYLVRRLLENGANATFVNKLGDPHVPIEAILHDPFEATQKTQGLNHPALPLPPHLFAGSSGRRNAKGFDTTNVLDLRWYQSALKDLASEPASEPASMAAVDVKHLMNVASAAWPQWESTPLTDRASMLARAADAMEADYATFLHLCQTEGRKTLTDAVAEVREAIDFLRYYADQALLLSKDTALPGPTGESNTLVHRGRGVVAAISPWNFPLAIFAGQVAAALVAGNTVIAKPAQQTPSLAAAVVALLHTAGAPPEALQLALVPGAVFQEAVIEDARLAGLVFTGSTGVARHLVHVLESRPQAPLIQTPVVAETGGLNAMIVDSSALFEQVVRDVIVSGFQSAGQRCSALRILYVQSESYAPLVAMIKGAMATLTLGAPTHLSTDIGPVIDAAAGRALLNYIAACKAQGYPLTQTALPKNIPPEFADSFVPPTLVELPPLGGISEEIFGPIVHVAPFDLCDLEAVIDRINSSGYGLTLGVHSRIDARIQTIAHKVRAGNIYVNRSMIGAVVGVQPFGGRGLSGTGPKAGGPNYVRRFMVEQTVTLNTMAMGGNAHLMAMNL